MGGNPTRPAPLSLLQVRLSLLQAVVLLIGVLLVALGVLGSVPGVTRGFADLHWCGDGSAAALFGVFTVSVLHNGLHLATGVAALAMCTSPVRARVCLVGMGGLYLALWIYGLLVTSLVAATNLLPVNLADTWLHLSLGIAMTGLGAILPWPSEYLGAPANRRTAPERR